MDHGAQVSVVRDPDTIALGFPVNTGDEESPLPLPFTCVSAVVRGEVPDTWRDVLINRFADSLRYLQTPEDLSGNTISLGGIPAAPAHPPLPVSPVARAVARILREDPASALSVPELADAVFTSPSTLNRLFCAETSLSVGAWRTRLRLFLAAVELRTPEVSIGSVAHRVGFSSASSLCRLFQRYTGMTPTHYRHEGIAAAASEGTIEGTIATTPATTPEGTGATRSTWRRTNRLHVLIWAWRGGCQVTAGGENVHLSEGDQVWLPAGVPNQVTMDPGGLVLPVGARAGAAPGHLHPMRAATSEDLLGALGREYDPVAPQQTELVDGLFYTYLSSAGANEGGDANDQEHTLRESRLLRELTEHFRRNPSVNYSLGHWSVRLGCSTSELTAALDLFGARDIRQWAAQVRMATARRLLASGIPVGLVARHLGYSSTASFSHVFRRAHGISPRGYTGYV